MKYHKPQQDAANKIIDAFKTNKYVQLLAQMQSGKTGTYLCVIEQMLKNNDKYAAIVLHDSNLELKSQIEQDLSNLVVHDVYIRVRVFHRNQIQKELKQFINCNDVALVVMDESHIAISNKCTLTKNMIDINFNCNMLSVSATPLADIVDNIFKETIILETTSDYLGIIDMFNSLNPSAKVLVKNKVSKEFNSQLKKFSKQENKYGIVRVTSEAQARQLSSIVISKFPNIKPKLVTQKVGMDTSFLSNKPESLTLVIINNALRVGKQVVTTHVSFVWDSHKSNTDTTAQGLLGRCCGYNKNREVQIYCDIDQAENYYNLVKSNYTDLGNTKTSIVSTQKETQEGEIPVAIPYVPNWRDLPIIKEFGKAIVRDLDSHKTLDRTTPIMEAIENQKGHWFGEGNKVIGYSKKQGQIFLLQVKGVRAKRQVTKDHLGQKLFAN